MANLSNINNKFLVTTGGNVGIGVTGPTRLLQLNSSGQTDLHLTSTNQGVGASDGMTVFLDSSGTGGLWLREAQSLRFATNSSEKMTILSGGNVGIGTTGPGYKLSVDDNTVTTVPKTLLQFDSGNIADNGGYNIDFRTSSNDTANRFVARIRGIRESTGALSQLSFWTESGSALEQRMTIRASGNVGIGTTTPAAKLDVEGGGRFEGNVGIGTAPTSRQLSVFRTTAGSIANFLHYTDSSNFQGLYIQVSQTTDMVTLQSSGASGGGFIFSSGNAEKIRFTATGNVGIGNTNPLAKLQITSGDSGASSPWSNADELVLESSGNAGLAFQTPNTGAATIAFQDPESVQAGFIQYLHADNALRFATNGNNERMRIKSDGNILIADTRQIQFYNTDQYIGATSTNDLEIGAGDDINYRSNFSRFFSGSAEHARLTGVGGTSWVVNGSATHNFGIGTTSPTTKCWVKDSQDSSLFSGLGVERSANTTGVCLNAVGGALNLNTNSSMPLKFRIQNTSMQTINTDGGRAYAGFGGWRMFEYSYTVSVGNGATVDLFQNTSAHSDLHMVQIAIRMFHSGRTYFVGSGVVGGYGMNITGSGSGATNGGLTSAVVSSGIRKLQISQSSGFTAQATIYIQFRLDSGSGINVLNGTLSSL